MTLSGTVDRNVSGVAILRDAIGAYGRHAATVVSISVLLQVVGALLALSVLAKTGPAGYLVISVISVVITQLMVGTSTLLLLSIRERGEVPPITELIGAVAKRLPSLLGLALLVGIGTGVATMFFVVPGIILGLGWAVAAPALIATRCGATAAMGQSWELTKGYRGDVFVVMLLGNLTGILAPRPSA